jgi:hypothetical protein
MKKAVLLSSLALVLPGITLAQNAGTTWGLKAGVALTTLSGPDARALQFDSRFGVQGGVFVNFSLTPLVSFQPELLYTLKGTGYVNSPDWYHLQYLDLPLPVQVNYKDFYVEAGPQLGYLLAAQRRYGPSILDAKFQFKPVDVGFVAGLGYQVKHSFGVGWRYNGGVLNNSKPVPTLAGPNGYRVHNAAYQFFITYALR